MAEHSAWMGAVPILLWKNWILFKRRWRGSAGELLAPVVFVAAMIGIWSSFATQRVPTREYSANTLNVLPVGVLPSRLALAGTYIAIAPRDASAVSAAASLVSFINATYPAFDGSAAFPNSTFLRRVRVPSLSASILTFPSEGALEAYIRNPRYGEAGYGPRIWGAIVVNAGAPGWDYSIRLNASEVTATQGPATDPLQQSLDEDYVDSYVFCTPSFGDNLSQQKPANPILALKHPGFMTLQLLVDRFAINRTARAGVALDALVMQRWLAQTLSFLDAPAAGEAAALDLTTQPQAVAALRSWFQAELLAPQEVTLTPFPVRAYSSNGFFTIAQQFLALFLVLAYLFPVSRLIRGLVWEKEARIREGMLMMGLSETSLLVSWLITYAILFFVIAVLLTALTAATIFAHTNVGIIFVTFLLFGWSALTFCYLVSVFFSKARTASALGVVSFLALAFPYYGVSPGTVAASAKFGASICSPTAFALAMDIISQFEANAQTLDGTSAQVNVRNYTLAACLLWMAGDMLLYLLLAWYADNTLPWGREVGIAKPWNFCCSPRYWQACCRPAAVACGMSEPTVHTHLLSATRAAEVAAAPQPIVSPTSEALDSHLATKLSMGACVSLRGLTRVFDTPDGPRTAVAALDADFFEGQIYVLLGHNGAGKSTTLGMASGLISASSGAMTAYGHNLTTEAGMSAFRRMLGVCPQFDNLYPELTVYEHLAVYAVLKQVRVDDRETEINKVINDVGLAPQAHVVSASLSGGMRRKLCLAIALLGGSKVVFLDEPTSGMDPYARRFTWNMLQAERSKRVIILTTHFMDEADILGDRVGIMSNGRLVCSGQPSFLKRLHGGDYMLNIVKAAQCDEAAIAAAASQLVPGAVVQSSVGTELGLRLPTAAAVHFPALFERLDEHADAWGIQSYGLCLTTMEEVFLKAAHDTTDVVSPASSGEATAVPVAEPIKAATRSYGTAGETASPGNALASLPLPPLLPAHAIFWRHMQTLLLKRFHLARRDWKTLVYQLLMPVAVLLGGLLLIQLAIPTEQPSYQLSTAQLNTNPAGDPNTPVHPNLVPTFAFKANGASSVFSPDVAQALFTVAAVNISSSSPFFSPQNASVISDPFAFVTSAASPTADRQRLAAYLMSSASSRPGSVYGAYAYTLNASALTTQDAAALFPQGAGGGALEATYTVMHNTTAFHAAPLFMNLMNSALLRLSSGSAAASITVRNNPLPFTVRQTVLLRSYLSGSAATIMMIAYAFIPASNAATIVRERETGAKHQQLMAGVSLTAYWLSNWVWDAATFIAPGGLCIMLFAAFSISDYVSVNAHRLNATFALFAMYGLAISPFTYLVSFAFKSHTAAQSAVLMLNITAVMLMIVSMIMTQSASQACVADRGLRYLWRFMPGYGLGNGLYFLAFMNILPSMFAACDSVTSGVYNQGALPTFDAFDMPVTGANTTYMGVFAVVYMVATIAVDTLLAYPALTSRLFPDPRVPDSAHEEDVDVAAEREVADVAWKGLPEEANKDECALRMQDLRKVYPGGKVALHSLTFSVPRGEVFGFLGTNGAGKTSTMKLLTGDLLPSRGRARVAGFDITTQQQQLRRLVGYTPQYDAHFDLMTTREHLALYAGLKGYSHVDIARVVEASLMHMDLCTYANRTAGTLSGGNKRKLSVAIAMIGAPSLMILDEPSTGVDPVARRFMWNRIALMAAHKTSVLLTTHSMEECEALCSRVGIMVLGRLRCIGSIAHLRHRFAKGYHLEVKLHAAREAAVSSVLHSLQQLPGCSSDVARAEFPRVCTALGQPARADSITESGSGWVLLADMQAQGAHASGVRCATFARWWAEETQIQHLQQMLYQQLHGATAATSEASNSGGEALLPLLERQGMTLRFAIEPAASVAALFRCMEGIQVACNVAAYSVSAATLESIFNQFAREGDESAAAATAGGDTARALAEI